LFSLLSPKIQNSGYFRCCCLRSDGWLFQSTVSEDHSVKVSGIDDLRRRGVTAITYIAVTPPDQTIDLPFPKAPDDIVVAKYLRGK